PSSSSSTAAGMRRGPRPARWARGTKAGGKRWCGAPLPPDAGIATRERGGLAMKLYVTPPSPRAFKVVAVMHHLALDAEIAFVDLLHGDHMNPEFAALNPNRKMPVLEDDGFLLWESNAIMQYLASKRPEAGLWPANPRHQADVSRWQCWELAHWERACGTLVFERFVKGRFGQGDPDPNEVARGERDFHQVAQVLDEHLRGRGWLGGRRLTAGGVFV